jgi:large subunit ribosomal protein L32
MAVPKRKTSKRVRNQRRSHHALKAPNLIPCSNCGALTRPHQVCGQCGHFKGNEVKQVEAF